MCSLRTRVAPLTHSDHSPEIPVALGGITTVVRVLPAGLVEMVMLTMADLSGSTGWISHTRDAEEFDSVYRWVVMSLQNRESMPM